MQAIAPINTSPSVTVRIDQSNGTKKMSRRVTEESNCKVYFVRVSFASKHYASRAAANFAAPALLA